MSRRAGLFGTLTDPDGNYIQIIQLSVAYEAARSVGEGMALQPHLRPFSGFAVDDVPTAARFYREALGMDVSEERGMLRLHTGAGTSILVYPKVDHVPASFTILNFPVADIDAAVDALARRGVTFERYDGIEADERSIFRGGPSIAWFNDPAGNLLSVRQEVTRARAAPPREMGPPRRPVGRGVGAACPLSGLGRHTAHREEGVSTFLAPPVPMAGASHRAPAART